MFDDRLIATRHVGYTPATGRILLRTRFNGLFGDWPPERYQIQV